MQGALRWSDRALLVVLLKEFLIGSRVYSLQPPVATALGCTRSAQPSSSACRGSYPKPAARRRAQEREHIAGNWFRTEPWDERRVSAYLSSSLPLAFHAFPFNDEYSPASARTPAT